MTEILSIVTDIALGATALKVAYDSKSVVAELKKLVDKVVAKQDNHEVRLDKLERKDA